VRWLITVAASTDLGALEDAVRSAQGSLRDVDPVPMGADEVVVFAEGPHDLPKKLRATDLRVLGVNPESEPTPY
jgi:hypothetical protein